MCGVFGVINLNLDSSFILNKEKTKQQLKNAILILQRRGQDGFGMISNDSLETTSSSNLINQLIEKQLDLFCTSNNAQGSSHFFTHFLHSIEGEQLQPLIHKTSNSQLVFNGEIYNYKQLNESLSIQTQNDSNTLFNWLNSLSNEQLKKLNTQIQELDGDYAFAYKREHNIYLARDYLGIKPLWYVYDEKQSFFAFSSEKKSLHYVCEDESLIQEVLPTQVIEFHINTQDFKILQKPPLQLPKETTQEYTQIKKQVYELLEESVKKRLPTNYQKKIGLLFSGGVDSTVLALILKKLGVKFTCYTAHITAPKMEVAQDYEYAKKIAQQYDLDLRVNEIRVDKLEELLVETMQLIEDDDYIKVSVALPFLASCKLAQEDGIDIMFSGLGSEEIFAGYRRHKQSKEINKECLNGLHLLHTRDLYRDDVVCMNCTQELRVPFLDSELIEYCLQIPAKYKIDIEMVSKIEHEVYEKPFLNALVRSKIVLRDIAIEYLSLEEEFANRQKKAAQYGSKFDKGILHLAKKQKLPKQEYLRELFIK